MPGLIELRDFKLCGLMPMLRRTLIPLERLVAMPVDLFTFPLHPRKLILRLGLAGVRPRWRFDS